MLKELRGRPKKVDAKNKTVSFRLSIKEYNKLLGISKLYSKEGLSDFVRMLVLESYEEIKKAPNN